MRTQKHVLFGPDFGENILLTLVSKPAKSPFLIKILYDSKD